MNTDDIMRLANRLAGLRESPCDSAVYVRGEEIKRVLAGIDVGVGELVAAKQLGYDMVLSHHPLGLPGSHGFYATHKAHMVEAGVPEAEAEAAVNARREEFELRDHIANHDHVASYARLIGMPLMNIHAAADELGRAAMQRRVDDLLSRHPDATVADVCTVLEDIEEIRKAPTRVEVRVGDRSAKAGRVKIAHGCYTNGGADVAAAYWSHGVRTVAYIHVAADALKRLRSEQNPGNLIITGHIASDEIGMNILVSALRAEGLTVDCVSGLRLLGANAEEKPGPRWS